MSRALPLPVAVSLISVLSGVSLVAQGLSPLEWQPIPIQRGANAPNGPIRDLQAFGSGFSSGLYAAGGGFMAEAGLKAVTWTTAFGIGFNGLCPGLPPCVGPTLYDLEVFNDGTGAALYAAVEWVGLASSNLPEGIVGWSGGFGAGAMLGGQIQGMRAIAVFDGGAGDVLHAGGSFAVGNASFIARWNGQSWAPLGAGVNGRVDCLFEWDDGAGSALYAGGAFSLAGGMPSPGIAKWDGAAWSPIGSGVGGLVPEVHALGAFDDGSGPALYVGGSFTTAGGLTANGIAKWDGSSWSSVGTGFTGGVPTTRIEAFEVHDDGTGARLFIGGRFAVAGSVATTGIAA